MNKSYDLTKELNLSIQTGDFLEMNYLLDL